VCGLMKTIDFSFVAVNSLSRSVHEIAAAIVMGIVVVKWGELIGASRKTVVWRFLVRSRRGPSQAVTHIRAVRRHLHF
jgi:hypothetical protein